MGGEEGPRTAPVLSRVCRGGAEALRGVADVGRARALLGQRGQQAESRGGVQSAAERTAHAGDAVPARRRHRTPRGLRRGVGGLEALLRARHAVDRRLPLRQGQLPRRAQSADRRAQAQPDLRQVVVHPRVRGTPNQGVERGGDVILARGLHRLRGRRGVVQPRRGVPRAPASRGGLPRSSGSRQVDAAELEGAPEPRHHRAAARRLAGRHQRAAPSRGAAPAARYAAVRRHRQPRPPQSRPQRGEAVLRPLRVRREGGGVAGERLLGDWVFLLRVDRQVRAVLPVLQSPLPRAGGELGQGRRAGTLRERRRIAPAPRVRVSEDPSREGRQ